jgi:hypothetical protein
MGSVSRVDGTSPRGGLGWDEGDSGFVGAIFRTDTPGSPAIFDEMIELTRWPDRS